MATNRFSNFPIAIYYSQNYKFFMRAQSRYRNDRQDSEHENVTYYYLLCRDSMDEYIYETVRKKA